MAAPLLEIDGLSIAFRGEGGAMSAVEGLSLAIEPGEILGIAGESGSGKSVTALALMGLLPAYAAITARRLAFDGQDLLALGPRDLDRLRGNRLAMIFQEPMTSTEPGAAHRPRRSDEVLEDSPRGLTARRGARACSSNCWSRSRHSLARSAADSVGLPAPALRRPAPARDDRHGPGAGSRDILIADEPTTALDVSIQAQILELIRRLRDETGMAVMIITHDLGVLSSLADRIGVMYAGELVELSSAGALFRQPLHPYADRLIKAAPRVAVKAARLAEIGGQPPAFAAAVPGCRFHPRCPIAIDRCRSERPALENFGEGRSARCFRAAEFAGTGLPA